MESIMEPNKVSNQELLKEVKLLRQDIKDMNQQFLFKVNQQFINLQNQIQVLQQPKAPLNPNKSVDYLFAKGKPPRTLIYDEDEDSAPVWTEGTNLIQHQKSSNYIMNDNVIADSFCNETQRNIPPVVLEVTTSDNQLDNIIIDDNQIEISTNVKVNALHENMSPYNSLSKSMYDESTHIANCTDRHCLLCKSLCVTKFSDAIQEQKSQWKCAVCQRYFRRKYNLKNHMRCHTGEKPYQCRICKHYFRSKQALNYHAHKHDKNYPHKKKDLEKETCVDTPVQINDIEISNEQKYGIPLNISDQQPITKSVNDLESNDKQGITGASYKPEYSMFAGCKAWTCPVCGKYFQRKANVKNHIRIHTGEKPYRCDDCGREFSVLYSLKIHQKTHTKMDIFNFK